jgi:hypothetical protein
MDLVLTRDIYAGDRTQGWLYADELKLATVERPWVMNTGGPGGMPRISCVPEGVYTLKPHDSDKFPGTYLLVNNQLGVYPYPDDIPAGHGYGRSAILIHQGNTVQDVIGCIAVGLDRTDEGVARSREGLAMLRLKIGRTDNHRLSIVDGRK